MKYAHILLALVLATPLCHSADGEKPPPKIVGHRGLILDAPENTLAGFAACIELRLGFELDVRRTSDGILVCLHDEDVNRTTAGQAKIAELTLREVRKLDAGVKFDAAFRHQRVPELEEVFALLRDRKIKEILVAVDLKIDDKTVEEDMIRLATKYGVLDQLVFIGRTIETPAVRKKLRTASAKAPVAVLAQTAKDLKAALDDPHGDWVYTRFIPTADEAAQIRKAGKKLFLSGPPVNNREPDNWKKAYEIGADALLTDFPLECRRGWRKAKE